MKIWKWFGWDTKEARTERNYNNNLHATIQTAIVCIALLAALYGCAQVM